MSRRPWISTPGMRVIWDGEVEHGLHRWPRVYMRRDLE
jgi:hypothetical protein